MSKILKALLLLILIAVEANPVSARPIGRRFTAQMSGGGAASNAALVPYWSDGLSLGNFDATGNWQELSGIAPAFRAGNEAYLWIISDSPANMLAAVSSTNASNQGVWTFQSPPTYVDIEDVETRICNGVPYLYFMDIGNNGSSADSRGSGIDIRVLRAVEPLITGSAGQILSSDYISINAAFPAGNPPVSRDMEATFIDPVDCKIYFLTKRDATQKLYSLPHQASYVGTQTLTFEGNVTSIPATTTNPLGATPCYAVDAAMNNTGTEILVKNYNNTYFYPRNVSTQTVIQALQQSLVNVPSYVGGGSDSPAKSHPSQEPQGEGLAYDKNGVNLYSNSEFLSTQGSSASQYPLFKYTRSPKVPQTTIFQNGLTVAGATYAGQVSTYVWETNPNTPRNGEATYVIDNTVGVPTDARKGLLKFDLTAIPTTATVTGCQLEQWIAAEGQGWLWYRMLVPWVATSTWNTLGGVSNDGVKAVATASMQNGFNLNTIVNVTVRDNMLVSDCQYMVNNPSLNEGWLGLGLEADDGVQFDGMSGATPSRKPKLTVWWYN